MKSVNDRVYLDYIEIEYKQHSVSKATVEHLESDIKTLIDSQGIKLTKILQIQLTTITRSAEKNFEAKVHLFKIREKLLRENTRLCFITARAKSLHLDEQDEYLTKVYSYIFSKNIDNDFIKNIKDEITEAWLREEPWFLEEPRLREIKRVAFYTVSNKTVEDLLDKMGENSNLPNSLKKALLSIPERISVETVKKIFNNVTGMCDVFSSLLKKEKYFNEIHSFNVLLVRYIRTQDERYFKQAKDGYRDLEESIDAAEEKNNAKQQLRQEEELLKKKLKEEPELKMDLEKLTQKYNSLSTVIEESDEEIYKKYCENKNIAEAGKFLETIESRLHKQKLLAQQFKRVEGFLQPEEEKTVNVGSYNSPHLENFQKIVNKLYDRQRDWKESSPLKFSGVKDEYLKLFTSDSAALKELEFNKVLNTNNPKEMDNFFNKVLKEIEDEKARRTAHSKAIDLEIKTLTGLESKINSVDFTPILRELSTVKKQADDLLGIPGFKEDKALEKLVTEISIRENKVKESQKKATAATATGIIFNRKEELESLFIKKEQLTNLLNEVEEEKKSHIEDSKKFSAVLKENTDRVLSSLKLQFSLLKKDPEDKLNNCKEKLKTQRKEAVDIGIELTKPDTSESKENISISISKVDKIETEAIEIIDEIDKTLTEIAENKEDSPKSMSDKITVIGQQPEKIKRYEEIIRNNENEFHKISGAYLKTKGVEAISGNLKTLIGETEKREEKYAAQVVCMGSKNGRKKEAVHEVLKKALDLKNKLDTDFEFKNDVKAIESELKNLFEKFKKFEAVTKTSYFNFFGTGEQSPGDKLYIPRAEGIFKTSFEELEKLKPCIGATSCGK